QLSRTFGPMVKILGNMLIDILVFLFLYGLIFLIFTCAAILLFHDLKGAGDFIKTAIVLFGASMGDFDYSVYDELDYADRMVGYAFGTLYLIISLITLLNFLIAILSHTYEILSS